MAQMDRPEIQKLSEKICWWSAINTDRPKLKLQWDGIEIEVLLDTGADVTIS